MNKTQPPNQIIWGDNLEILKKMESESVDLIYLDPPFFSNRNYEIIWGDEGEMRSFEDRWMGGIDHYIAWLKERVEQMHRVLKRTGSIFLHCDWHANAYIRVDILDRIFGMKNFRNEIIWCYTGPSSPGMKQFPRKTDTIWWYSKSGRWTFNQLRIPYKDPNQKPRRAYLSTEGDDFSEEKIEQMRAEGKPIENYWNDIAIVARSRIENIGYPTQKPEKLLQRIIESASKEGDIVLDPFMGGGTTLAVAERLGRRFIGIDQSAMSMKVTEQRLRKQNAHFEVIITETNSERKSA